MANLRFFLTPTVKPYTLFNILRIKKQAAYHFDLAAKSYLLK